MLDDRERFEEANAWNIEKCKENHWNVSLAVCYLLQGRYEIKTARLAKAEESLLRADAILRPGKLPGELSRLEWAWGLLAEARQDYKEGLRLGEEVLLICEDKGFRLQQADALCLHGRLLLLKFKQEGEQDNELLEKAGDCGHKALKIAEDSGYLWAKIRALNLLHSYHLVRAGLPAYDADTEKELAQRYLREAEREGSGLLTVSDEEFQEIKAETRKIFDEQVISKGK
jgi:tetratricopeptide (TPR) repeat protein